MGRLSVLLVAASLAGFAGPALAQRPATGRFLIASREVDGPFFAETVILLLSHGDDGSLGVVINRPMETTLAELLPDVAELAGRSDRAYLGGPVEPNRMLLLVEAPTPPPDSQPVVGNVYLTTSLAVLESLASGGIPSARFVAYAGYAGWGPGQLEFEIKRGDWLVDEADTSMLFASDADEVWPKLIERNSGLQARAAPAPETSASIGGKYPIRRR